MRTGLKMRAKNTPRRVPHAVLQGTVLLLAVAFGPALGERLTSKLGCGTRAGWVGPVPVVLKRRDPPHATVRSPQKSDCVTGDVKDMRTSRTH